MLRRHLSLWLLIPLILVCSQNSFATCDYTLNKKFDSFREELAENLLFSSENLRKASLNLILNFELVNEGIRQSLYWAQIAYRMPGNLRGGSAHKANKFLSRSESHPTFPYSLWFVIDELSLNYVEGEDYTIMSKIRELRNIYNEIHGADDQYPNDLLVSTFEIFFVFMNEYIGDVNKMHKLAIVEYAKFVKKFLDDTDLKSPNNRVLRGSKIVSLEANKAVIQYVHANLGRLYKSLQAITNQELK